MACALWVHQVRPALTQAAQCPRYHRPVPAPPSPSPGAGQLRRAQPLRHLHHHLHAHLPRIKVRRGQVRPAPRTRVTLDSFCGGCCGWMLLAWPRIALRDPCRHALPSTPRPGRAQVHGGALPAAVRGRGVAGGGVLQDRRRRGRPRHLAHPDAVTRPRRRQQRPARRAGPLSLLNPLVCPHTCYDRRSCTSHCMCNLTVDLRWLIGSGCRGLFGKV